MWKLKLEREGNAVSIAGTLQDAQRWLAASSFDLLMIQGGIPTLDWWQFYKLLRATPALDTMSVLLLLYKSISPADHPIQIDELQHTIEHYGDEIATDFDIEAIQEAIKRLLGGDNRLAIPQMR